MSVRVMTWVWQHSQSKKNERLVLLAIADCASDDGANAYPSMSELRRKTGLSERGVQSALNALVALGELFVGRNMGPRGCNRYRVNMRTPAESAPPQDLRGVQDLPPAESAPPQSVRRTPAESAPGTVLEPSKKISSTKRSSRRTSKEIAIPDRPDVEQVCRHLADRIEENGSKRPAITKTWRDAARRLIDKDGRSVEQVIRAIDWCQDDTFWRGNVLSMPKLREQYDRLRLAAQRNGARNGSKPSTTDQRVADAQALKAKFRSTS